MSVLGFHAGSVKNGRSHARQEPCEGAISDVGFGASRWKREERKIARKDAHVTHAHVTDAHVTHAYGTDAHANKASGLPIIYSQINRFPRKGGMPGFWG